MLKTPCNHTTSPHPPTHLLHVSASHKLGSKEELLPVRLFKVKGEVVERLLQVALVGVEDDGLLLVVLLHHLHREAGNGWLEVCLFSIHHDPHISCSGILEKNKVVVD